MRKFPKKLRLNRETLLLLDELVLRPVAGGDTQPGGASGCVCTWSDCSDACFMDPYTRCAPCAP